VILFLVLFSPYFGQGILGSGAKTAVIADTDDDIERANRLGTERSAGRRLDAPNARPVSCLLSLVLLTSLHVKWQKSVIAPCVIHGFLLLLIYYF
jgi:hypothetical protein